MSRAQLSQNTGPRGPNGRVWDNLNDAVRSLDTFIDGPYNRYPVVAG